MADSIKEIVVFGTGDHARVVVDLIESRGQYKIMGFLDNEKKAGEVVASYSVLGPDEEIERLSATIYGGVIAVGENQIRSKVAAFVSARVPDFNFVSIVHPFTAVARSVKIGAGTMVVAGAVINPDTKIGKHCIINTRASIDHDNRIGDFAFIAPGVITGGNVTIEDFAFISIGARIVPGVKIGKNSIIGAGSTVLNDVPSHVLAYGSPAKIVKRVE